MARATLLEVPILLVDDEEEILFSNSIVLQTEGFQRVLTETDSRKVIQRIASEAIGLVVLDLNMPRLSGYELLKEIVASHPELPVIIVTGGHEIEQAVECMRVGAFDYFVKPAEKERLLVSIQRALEMNSLRNELSLLTDQLLTDGLDEQAFAPIITCSAKMRGIFRYLTAVSGTDQPVLITGETGVGKELVARSLHSASGRKGQFVPVNVAGLEDQMFADTLFGHTKGAYTGADHAREGLVAKAAGGTLFLDEIGDLSLQSQIKLLRLLQEHEFYPLGSDRAKTSDARILVATNSDLGRMIQENTFRKDLYYRLKSHRVVIPPLRDRLEDVPLLLNHFIDEACRAMNKPRPTYPVQLLDYLTSYDFPGNVRELKGMIVNAIACHQKGVLSLASFREVIAQREDLLPLDPLNYIQELQGSAGPNRMPTLKDAEEALVAHALKLANNNQGIAAAYLGITRQALNKRLTRKAATEE